MGWRAISLSLFLMPMPAFAAPDHAAIAERAVSEHILPGFEALAAEAAALSGAATTACAGTGAIERPPLDRAYHRAFDAWIAVSHLRFGPTEENNAAFGVAFWPDSRGATPRSLAALIAAEDPAVDDPEAFRGVSVAARGLFALDQLLFDPEAPAVAAGGYRCRLLTAIAADLEATAATILARWRDPYAALLGSAGDPDNPVYLDPQEGTRELYTALTTGLQTTVDLRLGRPLGSTDRPQPRRAEGWRSGRPLRNVALALAATRDLAETAFLPELDPEGASAVLAAFDTAQAAAARIAEPLDAAVATPQGRIHLEALQGTIERLKATIATEIGERIGVSAGFNSQDGD